MPLWFLIKLYKAQTEGALKDREKKEGMKKGSRPGMHGLPNIQTCMADPGRKHPPQHRLRAAKERRHFNG